MTRVLLGQSHFPCAVLALHSPNTPSRDHIRLTNCVSGSNTSSDSSVSRVPISAAGEGDIDAAADDNAADTARFAVAMSSCQNKRKHSRESAYLKEPVARSASCTVLVRRLRENAWCRTAEAQIGKAGVQYL